MSPLASGGCQLPNSWSCGGPDGHFLARRFAFRCFALESASYSYTKGQGKYAFNVAVSTKLERFEFAFHASETFKIAQNRAAVPKLVHQ